MRRTQQTAAVPLPAILRAGEAVDGEIGPGELGPSLPADHPAWQRDVLAVSQRVRTLLATVTPVVVTVLTFWDHAIRTFVVGARRLEVDPSGCYRVV